MKSIYFQAFCNIPIFYSLYFSKRKEHIVFEQIVLISNGKNSCLPSKPRTAWNKNGGHLWMKVIIIDITNNFHVSIRKWGNWSILYDVSFVVKLVSFLYRFLYFDKKSMWMLKKSGKSKRYRPNQRLNHKFIGKNNSNRITVKMKIDLLLVLPILCFSPFLGSNIHYIPRRKVEWFLNTFYWIWPNLFRLHV